MKGEAYVPRVWQEFVSSVASGFLPARLKDGARDGSSENVKEKHTKPEGYLYTLFS